MNLFRSKTTTPTTQNSSNRLALRPALFLIPLALACFALSPIVRAVTPAPDGDYPNENTAEGKDALFSLDTSTNFNNTAVGFHALYTTVNSSDNTAIGNSALLNDTTGGANTATGVFALGSNTTGNSNTAMGLYALLANTTGNNDTANGSQALQNNTTGNNNTANGWQALTYNTTGNNNTATGSTALFGVYPSTGSNNTATGLQALYSYTTGSDNAANGYQTLYNNSTGSSNTAEGYSALFGNTTGSFNIAVGNNAGFNLTTGINNIDIGNPGVAGESKTIRIGKQLTQKNAYIAGISGVTVPTGIPVIVDTNGHLGTTTSSARFKEAITPMDKASEAILALQPVTFRYKHELDPAGIPQFGLVAEEVEKANPDLVARDEQGKPYTVRYDAVNAMLLNEFLKEHQKVQKLEAALAAINERFKAQDARIDKVSAKVELTKSAPQMVNNP